MGPLGADHRAGAIMALASFIPLFTGVASSYEVTLLLRSRVAVGRHQGVRPTSHSEGTCVARVEGG